jgi:thymidylate synthase (FAD)
MSEEAKKEYLFREEVLDHGFVELVDVLGSDQAIVNAARTSYDKGTKKLSSTAVLIRYLMRHKHSGPLEFGECVFRIRCPFFVARQWFRHRTASYNEVSLRYSEAVEEYYSPKEEWITGQDRRNKQARTDEIIANSSDIKEQLKTDAETLLEHYHGYLEQGVAREIARINLPLSLYTSFVFKIDLRNLLNFLTLRTDPHAQYEIRQYANIMAKMVEQKFPVVIQAWRDYTKNAISFSDPEIRILKGLFDSKFNLIEEIDKHISENKENIKLNNLELSEFSDKIKTLMGLDITLDYLGKDK